MQLQYPVLVQEARLAALLHQDWVLQSAAFPWRNNHFWHTPLRDFSSLHPSSLEIQDTLCLFLKCIIKCCESRGYTLRSIVLGLTNIICHLAHISAHMWAHFSTPLLSWKVRISGFLLSLCRSLPSLHNEFHGLMVIRGRDILTIPWEVKTFKILFF